MSQLRLLKVVVQPIFVVLDDEGGASELIPQPVTVLPAEWPTFATGPFLQATEALRAHME